jgi:CheY-like chemotaxis protein
MVAPKRSTIPRVKSHNFIRARRMSPTIFLHLIHRLNSLCSLMKKLALANVPRLLLALRMLSETDMKQRILVVDDEPQIREMLSEYFGTHGFETATAGDSEETLRAVENDHIDVVVLDIGLAEEDGLKLLEKLKASYPDLRVIMLTGMGLVEDLLMEAQQKGADGYVSKVLPLDELLVAINRILKITPTP